jgi:hypothetical protein
MPEDRRSDPDSEKEGRINSLPTLGPGQREWIVHGLSHRFRVRRDLRLQNHFARFVENTLEARSITQIEPDSQPPILHSFISGVTPKCSASLNSLRVNAANLSSWDGR